MYELIYGCVSDMKWYLNTNTPSIASDGYSILIKIPWNVRIQLESYITLNRWRIFHTARQQVTGRGWSLTAKSFYEP